MTTWDRFWSLGIQHTTNAMITKSTDGKSWRALQWTSISCHLVDCSPRLGSGLVPWSVVPLSVSGACGPLRVTHDASYQWATEYYRLSRKFTTSPAGSADTARTATVKIKVFDPICRVQIGTGLSILTFYCVSRYAYLKLRVWLMRCGRNGRQTVGKGDESTQNINKILKTSSFAIANN